MMKLAPLGLMAMLLVPFGAAQAAVPVPQVTTGSAGYLFPNDQYQRQREQRRNNSDRSQSRQTAPAPECSPNALPPAERRAMEARFNQIDRVQGRDAATAYAREEGIRFSQRLIDEGICTAEGQSVRGN